MPLEHESAARIRCSPARRKCNEDVHRALPGPSREHMMGSDSCCLADAPILGLRPIPPTAPARMAQVGGKRVRFKLRRAEHDLVAFVQFADGPTFGCPRPCVCLRAPTSKTRVCHVSIRLAFDTSCQIAKPADQQTIRAPVGQELGVAPAVSGHLRARRARQGAKQGPWHGGVPHVAT